jgi:DNA-binding MarR family transcriptional regulator
MIEAPTTEPQDHEAVNAVEREIGTLLRRARAMSAELGREVHPDLDSEAYGLLVGINDYGRARASELAVHFGLGKATISRQLTQLVGLGLIERVPDPRDGRAFVLVLTGEGRQRLENARAARRERWHAMLGTWPADDVRSLAELLARLNTMCGG